MKTILIHCSWLAILVGCSFNHEHVRLRSNSDPRIYDNVNLLVGIIKAYSDFEMRRQEGGFVVVGVDLPLSVVHKISEDEELNGIRLIPKELLINTRKGYFTEAGIRSKAVPVLSFWIWDFRSSNSCVVSLTHSFGQLSATTWRLEMRRRASGVWILVKKKIEVVA